jgi:tripartite-type tricarboxylate transporter receptor subunit TctC
MKSLSRFVLGAIMACAMVPALAGSYPSKPIRLIVPFPPGGGTDVLAREAANKVATDNGWNIVTENRPGSGGNIGVDAVVKAAPDGYTIVLGQTSNLAINPTLYPELPYDPEKDLTPVGLIASAPLVLAVSADSPYKTLADLVKAAKADPGALNCGTSGNGTVSHLASEKLQKAAGIKFTHIPYKGAAQGANDVIGGQIEMYMSSVPTLIGHIRSGRLRGLAVTSLERSNDLPDVPTVAESGYAGFEAVTWFGLAAPAGTPPEVVGTLNAAFNKALADKDLERKFEIQGAKVLTDTPETFGRLIHDDRVRWAEIIKESGAHID